MGAKLEVDAMGPLMGPQAHLAWMRHWRQVTYKESAGHITAVGAENFILGTDLGQTGNPSQPDGYAMRSEEHTSELQSLAYLVCRLLLEKKKNKSCNPLVQKRRSADASH